VLPKDDVTIRTIDKFGSYMASYGHRDKLPADIVRAYENFIYQLFLRVDSGSIWDGSSPLARAFIQVWLQLNELDDDRRP
jgi:hypothetical protein